MKQQLTWKMIFLSILGVTLLVIVAGLAVTLKVGPAKISTGPLVPKAQAHTVPSSLSLCTVASKVTMLTVRRGPYMNPTVFSFPAVVTVETVASARLVAKAICAITPDMSTGIYACPFDQGLVYQLTFTLPEYVVGPVLLRMGGCGAIEYSGAKGWIHPTQNFFKVLGDAMQLHMATERTFAGKIT